MIVGCYALDLYCPNAKTCNANGAKHGAHNPAGFTGNNLRDAKRQAIREGWKFRYGDCWCPNCTPTPSPKTTGEPK